MIMIRGCETPDELSNAELGRYYSLLMLASFNLQNWFFQTRDKSMAACGCDFNRSTQHID